MRSKLSHKIWGGLIASLAITSFCTTTLVLRTQNETLAQELQHAGHALARAIAASCVESLLSEDYPYLETQARKTAADSEHVLWVRILQANGDDGLRTVVEFPKAGEDDAKAVASAQLESSAGVHDFVEFTEPVRLDGVEESLGFVRIGLSTARLERLRELSTMQLLLGSAASAALLALILGFLLQRSVLRPVRALSVGARRIGSGDLETPVEVGSRDELGLLAESMETMRSSLKESHARIEAQVRELEEHGRMKDEFLANTSHELKTPLNGILGLAESIMAGAYGEAPGFVHEPLEKIVACGQRLRVMTESILKLSTLVQNSSQPPSERTSRNLREHVNAASIDLDASARQKGLEVRNLVPAELTATYRGTELEDLLRILVDNAIKYTERGWIEVLARPWRDGGPEGFQIAVRDTGVGISSDAIEKIFEPFVQGFDHERRSFGGVGLGLAIARRLAERLGAHLVVESVPGQGSTFTVLVAEQPASELAARFVPWPSPRSSGVPAEQAPATPGVPAAAVPEHGPRSSEPQEALRKVGSDAPYHLLLCDDDPINLDVLWGALHQRFRITRTLGGEECLEVLRAEPIDLLLLDVMMPNVSGFDVLRRMRDEGLLARVPVIILSAKTSPESIVKGLGLGAKDYLGKPFHRQELLRRIETQLEILESRNRLEQEVREKESALEIAQRASHVKTQFLANMSHEIRTPINGILGFTNLALCEEMTEVALQREYLENVLTCTESLLDVVDNILDVSRIESRDLELELEEVEAGSLFSDSLASWQKSAREKRLEFSLSIDPDLAATRMRTSASRLRQAVENLVHNAIKFTAEGRVDVRVSRLPGDDGQPDRLEVLVADTGIGIDASKLDQVFLPFMQADMEMNRRFEGIGVGLSLSRLIARLLGGDVEGESRPGQGSTFALRVPLESRSLERGAPAPSRRPILA